MGKIQLKLEGYLFYLLVFSIPFQTRIILKTWGPNFNEWMAAFFYGTDILAIGLLVSWLIRIVRRDGEFKFERWTDWFLALFVIFSAISLINAPNISLGLYQLIKLIQFALLYFYIKSNYKKVFGFKYTIYALIISGVLQGTIGLIQYIKQSSLGLKILGESVLAPEIYGVAAFKVAGELVLRAYGTFPHPNVLAAFLFISIYAFYLIYANWSKEKYWLLLFHVPMLVGFFLTYSRLVGFLWVLGITIRMSLIFFKKKLRTGYLKENARRLIYLTIVTVAVLGTVYVTNAEPIKGRLGFSPSEEAYVMRVFYNKKSLESFSLFGHGVGNHIEWLKEELPGMPAKNYQPVHNIYLLILNEVGFFGLATFILFLIFLSIKYFKGKKFDKIFHYSAYILFTSFLIMGFFDHYLWTLQQGRLMLWVLFGFLAIMTDLDK